MVSESTVRRVPRYWVALFFGGLLLLGGLVFADYGVSWDEPTDHRNGLVSLRYAAQLLAPDWAARQARLREVPPFEGYQDNDHGVLFELPLAWLDVVRPGTDLRTIYLLRHAAVFLVCWAGTWALYRLGRRYLRDERLGLLAAVLLWLSPRFFAESFYNGKDLVFTALFVIGAWAVGRWLARPAAVGRAVLAGLATAAATDVRLLGLLLAPMTLTLLAASAWHEPALRRPSLWVVPAYGAALALAVVVGWPYLWAAPASHLSNAFNSLSHFHWEGSSLYWGHAYGSGELPWHYAPMWMHLTTPLAYQAAAGVGVAVAAAGLLRRPLLRLRTLAGQLDALLLGWLLLPLALVIGLHSVLYDGWRHLYFVYPALLLLAVRGGQWLWQQRGRSRRWQLAVRGLAALAALEAVVTAGRMVWMHPHQEVYFTYLPAPVVERRFERDYWGLSFRQGLEYLVRQHPRDTIYYDVEYRILVENNKIWLPPADRARLVQRPGRAGRYFLTNYRFHDGAFPDSVGQEVFAVRAGNLKILSVFRRDRAGSTPYVDPHPAPPTPPAW